MCRNHLTRRGPGHGCVHAALLASLLFIGVVAGSSQAFGQGPLTNGWAHTGLIGSGGEVDSWTFEGTVGGTILVRVGAITQTNSFTPRIRLVSPGGQEQASSSGAVATELSVVATNSGTFTVMIDGVAADATGDYRLTAVSLPGPILVAPGDEGGPLTNGFTYTGVLGVGDLDVWTLQLKAGAQMFLGLGEEVPGGALTLGFRLFYPDGTFANSFSDPGSSFVSLGGATVDGTFTLVVGDYSSGYTGSGGYRLTFIRPADPILVAPGDEGGLLTNGVTHTGVIEEGDIDVWSFNATAGDNVFLSIGAMDAGSTLHPQIFRLGPVTEVAFGTSRDGTVAQLSRRVQETGTFIVVAGSHGATPAGGSGRYRLSLAKTGDPIVVEPADDGGPLTNGVMHMGFIDVGDLDVWNFAANAGDSIVVSAGEVVLGSSLTPVIYIYGPDGALVKSSVPSESATEVRFRATTSGTFTVVVGDGSQDSPYSSNNEGSGAYRLTLARTGAPIVVAPGDEGGPLTNGVMHTGVIDVGDLDVWNFKANAGETILLAMGRLGSGSTLKPGLWLYGPDGAQVAAAFGSSLAAQVSLRAASSGTFTVVVGDSSSPNVNSGGYRLTLAKTGSPIVVAPGDEGGQLTNGLTHTGRIDVGDLDVWNFTARTGDAILVGMGESAGPSSLTPALWLYGPDGALVTSYSSSSVASVLSAKAAATGTFTVVAGDASLGNGGTGAYRMSLVKTGEPVGVSPGDEGGRMDGAMVYDGILGIGDLDAWTFTACAGELISLRLEELNAGSSLTPALRLYGRDGTLLRTNSSASAVEFSVVAASSGTFLVVASDVSTGYSGTGAYRLTVNGLTHALQLCPPRIVGTSLSLSGVGGVPGREFVVLTSPVVGPAVPEWTPRWTNLFDVYGTFSRPDAYPVAEQQRFLILQQR